MATAPLTFAVEFATEAAEASLKGLTSTVGSTVQGIFGQLSPSNLVTQIAQQTLGVGSLAGNLVNGGVGAIANSRFGYLSEMGAGFNAENAAMGSSISQIRQQTALGLAPTADMEDSIWRVNLARFQAEERSELEFKRRHAGGVAEGDWQKALKNGTRAWGDVVDAASESTAARFWAERGLVGGLRDFLAPMNPWSVAANR